MCMCVLFSYFFSFEHQVPCFASSDCQYYSVDFFELLLLLPILSEFCIGAPMQCINANSTLCVFMHVDVYARSSNKEDNTSCIEIHRVLPYIVHTVHTCMYCSVMHADWIEVVREKRAQRRF